jgi:hypothetical protein
MMDTGTHKQRFSMSIPQRFEPTNIYYWLISFTTCKKYRCLCQTLWRVISAIFTFNSLYNTRISTKNIYRFFLSTEKYLFPISIFRVKQSTFT